MGNWLSDLGNRKDDRKREREEALLEARHAEEGAPRFYKSVEKRVEKDLRESIAAIGDQKLQFSSVPSKSFIIRRPVYPAVTLKVELVGTCLEYSLDCRVDDTSNPTVEESHFHLVADLKGNLVARQGEMIYTGAAEVSEKLLLPLMQFLDEYR